jgi:hypothetical protein
MARVPLLACADAMTRYNMHTRALKALEGDTGQA